MTKKKNKFAPLGEDSLLRKQNTREEKKIAEELAKIVFSFKDFDRTQIPPGQSYGEWQENELLACMLEKFGAICQCNIVEAQQQKMIKIYPGFPENSGFKYPKTVKQDGTIKWAVIMNIGGQQPRVAGHVIGHVFYVVFLDAEHQFFPTELKKT